jgi:hypothetical protein
MVDDEAEGANVTSPLGVLHGEEGPLAVSVLEDDRNAPARWSLDPWH